LTPTTPSEPLNPSTGELSAIIGMLSAIDRNQCPQSIGTPVRNPRNLHEFVPGEFGAMELPEIPEGFRFATHVSVFHREQGQPVGRWRRLMAVCEGEELKRRTKSLQTG